MKEYVLDYLGSKDRLEAIKKYSDLCKIPEYEQMAIYCLWLIVTGLGCIRPTGVSL